MKTTYTCETCGKPYDNWEACRDHEKVCEEEHATGVRLAHDISGILKRAKAAGVALLHKKSEANAIVSAEYSPAKKAVLVTVARISTQFDTDSENPEAVKYQIKTIKSGDNLESEIFPTGK